MTLTLAQFQDRIGAALMDAAGATFSDATLQEALRTALHEYTEAAPLAMETVLVLPADGREIALDGLAGLIAVTRVWWPYDYAAAAETWPPNRVGRWSLWWDYGRPVLFLEAADGGQPQAGDEVRIWYTRQQTIQDLDAAAATTVPLQDESMLVQGAAAYAMLSRSTSQAEIASTGAIATPNYAATAFRLLRQFRAGLAARRHDATHSPEPAWTDGWALDRWGSPRWLAPRG